MTKEELISKGKTKVRNTPSLLSIYLEMYQDEFGRRPNCAGCTFSNDWDRFISGNKERQIKSNQNNMSEKTFRLKKIERRILTFKAGNVTYRKYDNKLTEEWAIAYLTNGTDVEIKYRKTLFSELPISLRPKPKKTKK